jgi:hypothetical protein
MLPLFSFAEIRLYPCQAPRTCMSGRMPKTVNRLSAVKVGSTKKPGFYADDAGLYLHVNVALVFEGSRTGMTLCFPANGEIGRCRICPRS